MSEESKIALEKTISEESVNEEIKENKSTIENVNDNNQDENNIEDDDDEIDMSPAESCGFCAHFLNSPCAKEFDKWRKCVEKAKDNEDDFTKTCMKFTSSLAICTENNKDYFDVPEEEVDEANINDSDINDDNDDNNGSNADNSNGNSNNEEKNEDISKND